MIQILQGDCRDVLKTLPSESIHCVVTSPPYWGLRDYGVEGQLGLEKTPEEYVAKMVTVFQEVRRVLRDDGTLWLNLGDSYNGSGGWGGDDTPSALNGSKQTTNCGSHKKIQSRVDGLKPKDLCGIPWRLAFALQADGWWLRQDIIWAKPNPMPESVTDRCTKAHEYLFLLTKSARYFFDAEAIKEPSQDAHDRLYADGFKTTWTAKLKGNLPTGRIEDDGGKQYGCPESGRNRRSVWTINSEPYPESHFATFPTALVKPCILAGTSARGCCPKCGEPWERVVERGELVPDNPGYKARGNTRGNDGFVKNAMTPAGSAQGHPNFHYERTTTGWRPTCECGETDTIPATVLDPFGGSGTVGQVALELGRKAILIELNPSYVKLAEKRTNVTPGLQLA